MCKCIGVFDNSRQFIFHFNDFFFLRKTQILFICYPFVFSIFVNVSKPLANCDDLMCILSVSFSYIKYN